jgi:hypothetical protein
MKGYEMKKNSEIPPRMSFELPVDLSHKLRQDAEREEISISIVIRRILRAHYGAPPKLGDKIKTGSLRK